MNSYRSKKQATNSNNFTTINNEYTKHNKLHSIFFATIYEIVEYVTRLGYKKISK